MEKQLVLTDKNFKKEVLESNMPVLVDFWASWCPPCKMVEPVIKELAAEVEGKMKIRKLNVDQNHAAAADYNISGVPTFIVFKSGEEILRRTGAQSKQQLKEMLKEVLGEV